MTTSSTVLDLATVTQLVANFDKNFKDVILGEIAANDDQIEQIKGKSEDRTYDMLAALVDLASSLNVKACDDGFKQFLAIRNQQPARGANNPYMPFIKAVYSVKKSGQWVFEARKAEKYANIVRHLVEAIQQKRLTGTIQDYIRTYSDPVHGTKMLGIEKQDRFDHPSQAQADRVRDTRNRGRQATPKTVLDDALGFSANDVVKLWGRVANGKLEIMGLEVANDDEANSLYYKLGSTIPK